MSSNYVNTLEYTRERISRLEMIRINNKIKIQYSTLVLANKRVRRFHTLEYTREFPP